MFPYLKISEEEIKRFIDSATPEMVTSAINKTARRNFEDLLTLISPAAAQFVDQMHPVAQKLRFAHYGKTVRIYAPLYITNKCVNSCKYCDFSINHKYERKALAPDEIYREAKAIRDMDIDSILLVAGEDPVHCGANFLAEAVKNIRPLFSYISIEVAPMSEEDYRKLFHAGVEGVTLYQETYDQTLYADLHPSGPKRDYLYRLETQMRAGKAGMRNLGMGFLLGLYPWRIEAASLAAHAMYLAKHCWQSKIQFSFPRITPITGSDFIPASPVSERELEQMMLAFRLVFPEQDMTISTRERAQFRDKMVLSCVGNMSAGSRVTPGGYAILADEDLGQFTLNDSRSAEEVAAAIKLNHLEVVRKFWDRNI